ncbi:MAG: hypothetical protein GX895_00145 [Clostridiales bacterium]|uniref:hypothetical protein n=1 Tax=Clostridium sp. N3C TaxID=1776758 RepID=UPI00092DF5C9|nr:hypothetical protein [Clostridium sp. N3C]NLZ47197.1 hypothetical protein [Clostridiales bacterium]SCN25806.1 hypothetical protein N3C_2527 [Clostridium sp. N3C]
MLRNFISVTGITQEKDLPKRVKGELLQHSDIDYIFIPGNRPRIKELTHISISVDIKNHRIIKSPKGSTIVLDGLKKLKITYVPEGRSKKTIQAELYLPYNTYLELPDGVNDIGKVDVYILDAYFELIEGRKIYSFIFYMLDIEYKSKKSHRRYSDEDPEDVDTEESEIEPKENMPPKLESAEDFLNELQKSLFPFTNNESEFSFEDDLDEDNIDEENTDYDEKDNGET